MLIHLTPGALVWPAAMIVWGPGFTTAGHRHHCVQLIMAMRGTLLIRGNSDDQWMRCGAALVGPDAAHEVDARDTNVLIGFVDSESELGAALSAWDDSDRARPTEENEPGRDTGSSRLSSRTDQPHSHRKGSHRNENRAGIKNNVQ